MDIFQITDSIKEFFIPIKDWIISINWLGIIAIIKSIAIVISIILFIGIVEVIVKLNLVSRAKKTVGEFVKSSQVSKKMVRKWEKIEKRLKLDTETELKLAVIEADKFFDKILKRFGYFGKDMGERLKRANTSQISNLDQIWEAHKVRNKIVHDSDYSLNAVEAKEAIESYKTALKEMGILQ